MKSQELVPLINSSACHQSDMKCNLYSKSQNALWWRERRGRCITQVVMAGGIFLGKTQRRYYTFTRCWKAVFSNHTEAFAVFFSSPGKHVCITMYFSSADMPVRSTTGLADGSPSPLCPNREVLAALPQQHIWEGHSTALWISTQHPRQQGQITLSSTYKLQKSHWSRAGLQNWIKAHSCQHQKFQQVQQASDQTSNVFSCPFTQRIPKPDLRVLQPLNLQL